MTASISDKVNVYLDELNTSAEITIEHVSAWEGEATSIPVYYGLGVGKHGMRRYAFIRALDYHWYVSRCDLPATVQERVLKGIQYIAIGIS